MSRDRWHRAALAGARSLNRTEWDRMVKRAADAMHEHYARLGRTFVAEPRAPELPRRQHVILESTMLVVDAQMVLDLELALTHAEMLAAEIEQLASEDVDSARRARLMRTIERCREAIAKRLARGVS